MQFVFFFLELQEKVWILRYKLRIESKLPFLFIYLVAETSSSFQFLSVYVYFKCMSVMKKKKWQIWSECTFLLSSV